MAIRQQGLQDPQLLAHWFVIACSREVLHGKPLARRLLGCDVVLWRSAQGVHCWRDLCIHRGARLSLGTVCNDRLVCPYHAWEYNSTGQCVQIPSQPHQPPPARARAQTFHVRERYGLVWVWMGESPGDLPLFPLGDEPGMRLMLAGPYVFRAQGPRVIENFLDVAHLGFVHAGLLGDWQHGEIEDYEVETGPQGPEANCIRIWQPDPDGTGKGALVSYRYWVAAPLTTGLTKTHNQQRFGLLMQVAPVDAETSVAHVVIAMDYAHDVAEDVFVGFQDLVAAQDKRVVESQRPELLPLDLPAELHLRSDRMAIAYRKWLRAIDLSYGTA